MSFPLLSPSGIYRNCALGGCDFCVALGAGFEARGRLDSNAARRFDAGQREISVLVHELPLRNGPPFNATNGTTNGDGSVKTKILCILGCCRLL